MYKLHHVNFYNISSQIDQYIIKTSSVRAYQGPKRRKILISLWAMSTLVPFKLGQSVTYRDVFYIIFSGRKCDHTVCCNSLVRGVATADGNRVARRLYCHVRKFLAASNFRRLSTKFCWNQNLGGCRYALLGRWNIWGMKKYTFIFIFRIVVTETYTEKNGWDMVP